MTRSLYHGRPLREIPGSLAIVLAILSALSGPARAQIVNTLEDFDPAASGFDAVLDAALDASGGNTETFDVAVTATLQWANERDRLRAILGYDLERADGADNADDAFVHLRHNRAFGEVLNSLLFVQWQRNPFQRLRSRFLLGVGARFDLVRAETVHLRLGAAHMVEIERIDGGTEVEDTDQRLSSFLDFAWRLPSGVTFSANAFVQPRWDQPDDLRAIASAGLEAPLGGGFALRATVDAAYDSEPPDDVDELDWDLATGLRFRY